MAEAKTISSELTRELNDALHKGRHQVTEFELKKWERNARALSKVDSLKGFNALGSVFSLKKDIDSSINWHQQALMLAPESWETNFNFAASMSGLGQYSMVREITDKLLRLLSDANQTWDRGLYDMLIGTGQFQKAVLLEPPADDLDAVNDKLHLTKFLERSELKDEDIYVFYNSLEKLYKKHNFALCSQDITFDDTDIHAYVTSYISVDAKESAELNWEFSELLSEFDICSETLETFTIGVSAA